MNLLILFVYGLVLGLSFKYFPNTSLILAVAPCIFYFYRKRYLFVILSLIAVSLGFFYFSLFEEKKTYSDILVGTVISKNENSYLIKTSDKELTQIFSYKFLEIDKTYKIKCYIPQEFKNPYVEHQKKCFVKEAEYLNDFKTDSLEALRKKITESTRSILKEEVASLLTVMTVGKRVFLSKETVEDFQKTGLIHLLSISGAHFSLLFTASFLFFNFLIKRLPYHLLVNLTIYIKPSQLSIFLCLPIIFGYFLLIEPSYPSTRAFIMAFLFMIGVFTERKTLWLKTLLIACTVILLIEPKAIKDLSFQLSFLATFGVGFASDIYKELKSKISNKVFSYLILSFLVSFSATLITAPLVILRFHYFSLIGPLANVTAGLLIGLILFPLHVFFIIVYIALGIYPFADLMNFLGSFVLGFINKLATFKYSSFNTPAISSGVVLLSYVAIFTALFNFYFFGKRRILYAFSLCIIIFLILLSILQHLNDKNALKITFLDVGNADATVLEFKDKVFVVDTGKTGFEVERYLKVRGIRSIDAIIITHADQDHAGGFHRLLKNFRINEIWDNGFITYNIPDIPSVRHLQRGDLINYEGCLFTVLHPYREFYVPNLTKSSNELSLVFSFRCFKNRYLFTSDAGQEALSSIPVNYLATDIVKIPHHGSKNSFFKEFYDVALPRVCIITTKNTSYEHTEREMFEFLKTKCKIYVTASEGAVQIKEFPNGKIIINTFSDYEIKPIYCCFRDFKSEFSNLKKLFVLW
ncbi:MAG: ComEC/Rec2 family competence protein [Thermodesulfovibrionaceae bacterium]